jgi:hypothetical protein
VVELPEWVLSLEVYAALTETEPVVDGRKDAVQVAVSVVVPGLKVQGLEVPKDPVAVPVVVNVTVPVGVVGLELVSVTVAVQTEAWFTTTAASQPMEMLVGDAWVTATVTVAAELVLVLWVESPPYEAMTDPEPAVVPVNMTEQLPAESVHVVALSEPPVVPAVNVKVTMPDGVFADDVVSVTVAVTDAVQLDPPSAIVQLTLGTVVDVLSLGETVTVTVAAVLELVL